MVGGAAANDIDAAHIFDGFFIQVQLAQINAAILDAGAEGIPHSGGLFVDLLHHKVLVTAFFGGFGVPLDGAGFFFNRFFINVEKLNTVRGFRLFSAAGAPGAEGRNQAAENRSHLA